MNLREALQALIDGKKIRRKHWTKEEYIYLDAGMLKDHLGDIFTMSISEDTNFELYEELKKPIESLNKALDKFMKSSGNFNFDTIDIINKIIQYLNEKENERETNQ